MQTPHWNKIDHYLLQQQSLAQQLSTTMRTTTAASSTARCTHANGSTASGVDQASTPQSRFASCSAPPENPNIARLIWINTRKTQTQTQTQQQQVHSFYVLCSATSGCDLDRAGSSWIARCANTRSSSSRRISDIVATSGTRRSPDRSIVELYRRNLETIKIILETKSIISNFSLSHTF